MRKKLTAVACILTIACSMLFTGCRSVSISGDGKSSTEDETTKKSSTKETTKSTKKNTKETTTEETTKKKSQQETTTESGGDYGWKTYSTDDYSIDVNTDDWLEAKLNSADFAFTNIYNSNDGFADNINIATQDLSLYSLDLEGYKDLSLKQFDQLGYTLVSADKASLDGVDGYLTLITTQQSGINVKCEQFFTVIGKKAFIFSFTADEKGFTDLENDFYDMLDTVIFTNAEDGI